jgi:hypothetical protein
VWVVPSEIGRALEGLGSAIGTAQGIPQQTEGPRKRVSLGEEPSADELSSETSGSLSSAHDAVAEAIASADAAARGRSAPSRATPSTPEEESGDAGDAGGKSSGQ